MIIFDNPCLLIICLVHVYCLVYCDLKGNVFTYFHYLLKQPFYKNFEHLSLSDLLICCPRRAPKQMLTGCSSVWASVLAENKSCGFVKATEGPLMKGKQLINVLLGFVMFIPSSIKGENRVQLPMK